jgi:photosystem II stability/assembly factor-like uncharacterized protein
MGMSSDERYLYRTRDGGQTWVALEMPRTGSVVFTDASTGWLVGGRSRHTSPYFLHTQDGGDTWESVNLTLPESLAEIRHDFQVPAFFSHQEGVLPLRFYREADNILLVFYATQNGGETWSLAAMLEEPDTLGYGRPGPPPWAAIIDEKTWIVPLHSRRKFITRNGGQTWEEFSPSGLSGANLTDLQFASEMEGWGLATICDRDADCVQPLFATHDGGHTWIPLAPIP